ncbi:MAG: putative Ig domain-containing protein [Bdellovibrionales bacterium]
MKLSIILLFISGCFIQPDSSTNTEDQAGDLVLSYPDISVGEVGENLSIAVTKAGAELSSISVSPSLPAGLSLDSVTGDISGTASSPIAKTEFTISYKDPDDSISKSVTLDLQINAVFTVDATTD